MQNYTTIIGILRMRQSGCSYRECKRRFGVGTSTVTLITKRFAQLDLPLSELEKQTPQKVEEIFYPPELIRRKDAPLPDYEAIYRRLLSSKNKANLFFQWTEYKKEFPDGYQYSQFVEYFNRYIQEYHASKKAYMPVERIPGERVYIDWVGDQPEIIVNSEDGTFRKAHIFVTTVGISNYMYVELFPDEKMRSFIEGTIHALEFYGAVPRYLVPDNAATAVTKHTKDTLLINSSYQDLEAFYNTIVLPPPAYKPKGKPTVEKHVQIVETWLIEKLKENMYYSFSAVNAAAQTIIADINSRTQSGFNLSRREMFEQYDKPQMKALSDGSFTVCDYVSFNKVPDNYHLLYDDHYYSVLYTYCGKPVILKATMTEIRICDQYNKLICVHPRSYRRFPKYITDDSHMPENHRYYKEVNSRDGEYYRRWASAIGAHMNMLIDVILHSARQKEQTYNSCNGILHMCDGKSKVLADKAAEKCIAINSCNYSTFKRIFNDLINNGGRDFGESLPQHENIRGKDYYK